MKFLFALASVVLAQQDDKVTSDPIYTCNPPSVLQGKECVNFTQEEPIETCRAGTIRNGNSCVTEFARVTKCPNGSVEKGKQCVVTETVAPVVQCPRPFEQSGNSCVMQVPLPMTETCEIGSREGPDCVKFETAPHTVTTSCPAGYEDHQGKGCYKTVQYDCTPLGQGKGGAGLRGLAGSSQPVNPKFDIPKQTCERKEAAARIVTKECPAGFEENYASGTCVKREVFAPVKKCSNGGPIEACYTIKETQPESECPNGYITDSNQCIKYEIVTPETYCSEGIDNGRSCQREEPIRVSCNPGLTLEGNICVGKQVSAPVVTVVTTCTGKDCYNH